MSCAQGELPLALPRSDQEPKAEATSVPLGQIDQPSSIVMMKKVRSRLGARPLSARWLILSVFAALTLGVLPSCEEKTPGDYTVEEHWIVGPQTEIRFAPGFLSDLVECLLVRPASTPDADPTYIPKHLIAGFDYEPGYRYVISVWITYLGTPPMDSSGRVFVLRKVISKQAVEPAPSLPAA